jgi:hypothetical protein
MTTPAPETIGREQGKKINIVWRDLSGSPDLVQAFSTIATQSIFEP